MKRRAGKVHTVSGGHPSLKGGYIGMNKRAAKAHHLDWPFGAHDIAVKKGLSKTVRKHTIKHERVEMDLMDKGKRYKTAHKMALKAEKQ